MTDANNPIFPTRKSLMLMLLISFQAQSQNLLFNPDFDENVDSWVTSTDIDFFWSPLNADHHSNSGAIEVYNYSLFPEAHNSVIQCVSGLDDEQTYEFGGKGLNHTESRAYLKINFFSGSGCFGDHLGTFQSSDFISPDDESWVYQEVVNIIPPELAQGIMFEIVSAEASFNNPATVYFDQLFFGVSGTTQAIFKHSFENQ